jgi:hypothetical protein
MRLVSRQSICTVYVGANEISFDGRKSPKRHTLALKLSQKSSKEVNTVEQLLNSKGLTNISNPPPPQITFGESIEWVSSLCFVRLLAAELGFHYCGPANSY